MLLCLILKTESHSRVKNCNQIKTKDHGKYVSRLQIEVTGIVESVMNPNKVINQLVNCIFLRNTNSWPSKEIKSSEVLAKWNLIDIVSQAWWQLYLDVWCPFWKNNLELVVFSKWVVVSVHKWDFKSVKLLIGHVFVQVVLRWHVVSLIPVSLPLSEQWESKFDFKFNAMIFSLCIWSTNIANVVIVI